MFFLFFKYTLANISKEIHYRKKAMIPTDGKPTILILLIVVL